MNWQRRGVVTAALASTGVAILGSQARPQGLTKITLSQATDSLSFMPIYVARALNLFEKEGIDLSVLITDGDGPDVQALLSNEVQFAASNSAHLLTLYQQGKRLTGIGAVLGRLANNVCIRKDAAAARGITESSPFDEKIMAFKGLKVGCSVPGSLTFNLAMHYIHRAGLTPQVDAQVIAVGAGAAAIAAIERNVVDAYIFGSPLVEQIIQRGSSMMLINNTSGEDPNFNEFIQATLYVKPDYAKNNPELTRSFARAVVGGSAWIKQKTPEEIARILTPYFGRIDQAILVPAIANVKQAVVGDGRVSPGMVTAVEQFYIEIGTVKQPIPFDAIYNNDYLPA
jgi:NitT/TauT family transport system substrate-binding protein